jgi:hypothetical protein
MIGGPRDGGSKNNTGQKQGQNEQTIYDRVICNRVT